MTGLLSDRSWQCAAAWACDSLGRLAVLARLVRPVRLYSSTISFSVINCHVSTGVCACSRLALPLPCRSLIVVTFILFRTLAIASVAISCLGSPAESDDWPYYGHDAGGMRYSPLAQINRENVSQLKVAWVFHTGDISDGSGGRKRSGFETTPILVDGTLYLTTPFNRVIALDPETGSQRWAYDPKTKLTWDYGDGLINRGVATWSGPAVGATRGGNSTGLVQRRIFEATLDARLIALDAATGTPCPDFGKGGEVSLREVARYSPGQYHMTSPPAVIDDVVVVGSAIDDT